MNLRGDARGGHHSRMRAPGSSDGRAEDAPEGSDPSPPRQPWRKHERERLRRALLRFGLGRWRAVHEASRVEGRAALDVRLACFDFAHAVAERARDAHVKTYLAARLADAPRASRESPSPRDRKPLRPNASTELRLFGPDPLVGPWSKVPRNADAWARRLRLLDAVNAAAEKCVAEETREEALALIARAFHSDDADADGAELPMTRTRTEPGGSDAADDDAASRLPPWWSPECDAALLFGIRRHGFGAYDETRRDAWCEPVFAEAASANGGEEARAAFEASGRASRRATTPVETRPTPEASKDDDEESSKSEDDEKSSSPTTTTKVSKSDDDEKLQSPTTASLSPTTRTAVVVFRPEKAARGVARGLEPQRLAAPATLTARVKRLAARLSAPGACVARTCRGSARFWPPAQATCRADSRRARRTRRRRKTRAKRRREEKRRRLGSSADAMLRGGGRRRWTVESRGRGARGRERVPRGAREAGSAGRGGRGGRGEAAFRAAFRAPRADPSPDPASFPSGSSARSSARSSRKLAAAKAGRRAPSEASLVEEGPESARRDAPGYRRAVESRARVRGVALATRAGVARRSAPGTPPATRSTPSSPKSRSSWTSRWETARQGEPPRTSISPSVAAPCVGSGARGEGRRADEARSKDEGRRRRRRTKDQGRRLGRRLGRERRRERRRERLGRRRGRLGRLRRRRRVRDAPERRRRRDRDRNRTERERSPRGFRRPNANASSRPSIGDASSVCWRRRRRPGAGPARRSTPSATRRLCGPGGVASFLCLRSSARRFRAGGRRGCTIARFAAGAARHGFEGGTLRGVASDPGLPFAERPEGDRLPPGRFCQNLVGVVARFWRRGVLKKATREAEARGKEHTLAQS